MRITWLALLPDLCRQYVLINAGGHYMFKRGYGDYLYAFALPNEILKTQ